MLSAFSAHRGSAPSPFLLPAVKLVAAHAATPPDRAQTRPVHRPGPPAQAHHHQHHPCDTDQGASKIIASAAADVRRRGRPSLALPAHACPGAAALAAASSRAAARARAGSVVRGLGRGPPLHAHRPLAARRRRARRELERGGRGLDLLWACARLHRLGSGLGLGLGSGSRLGLVLGLRLRLGLRSPARRPGPRHAPPRSRRRAAPPASLPFPAHSAQRAPAWIRGP